MVKSFAAFGIFALLGTCMLALPSFAPTVQASEAAALSKGDRLDIRAVASKCSAQVWPDFTASCLRKGASGAVLEARLVTARR
jgi:coenzyme F420-reducing hydrogenase delta subunit